MQWTRTRGTLRRWTRGRGRAHRPRARRGPWPEPGGRRRARAGGTVPSPALFPGQRQTAAPRRWVSAVAPQLTGTRAATSTWGPGRRVAGGRPRLPADEGRQGARPRPPRLPRAPQGSGPMSPPLPGAGEQRPRGTRADPRALAGCPGPRRAWRSAPQAGTRSARTAPVTLRKRQTWGDTDARAADGTAFPGGRGVSPRPSIDALLPASSTSPGIPQGRPRRRPHRRLLSRGAALHHVAGG